MTTQTSRKQAFPTGTYVVGFPTLAQNMAKHAQDHLFTHAYILLVCTKFRTSIRFHTHHARSNIQPELRQILYVIAQISLGVWYGITFEVQQVARDPNKDTATTTSKPLNTFGTTTAVVVVVC